jgi:alkylation response protein AidB-like acyl-CoA dehydrogenase
MALGSGSTVLDAARELQGLIRDEAAAGEEARRLTAPVVQALRDSGVFAMCTSAALGGRELTPLEQIEVVEVLSAADGAAGWCAMIGCDGGMASAYLDPTVARALIPSADAPCAFVASPGGTATPTGDGYRVQGQWAFASGSSHAEVFFVNCLDLDAGGNVRPRPAGLPAMRAVGIPRDQVEVLDTWHTTGLAATASNDVKVDDVEVPAERTFDIIDGTPLDPAPLYRWRWFLITKVAGVPLGVARAAIDEARSVAEVKVSMPAMVKLRDDALVQQDLGRAEALLGSARAYVHDTVGRCWDEVCRDGAPDPRTWTDVRLAMTNAATSCRDAVGLAYAAVGTTGVFRRSPLDRQMRDATTMAQHVVLQHRTYGAAGRTLLGLPADALGF